MPQIQVIPAAQQRPGFGSQLGAALGGGLSQGLSAGLAQMLETKKREKQLGGLEPFFEKLGVSKEAFQEVIKSGLDPQLVATLGAHMGTQQESRRVEEAKRAKELKETVAPLKRGLKLLDRQEELFATGHLGSKLGGFGQKPKILSAITPEGQKVRGEYERIGKALISLGSNVPIKNQMEFNTLAENLYDPSLPTAEIRGVLDGMRKILETSIEEEGVEVPKSSRAAETQTAGSGDVMMRDRSNVLRKVARKDALEAQNQGYKLEK